jgi:predicted ATPase
MIEGKFRRKDLPFAENKSVPIDKVLAIDISKFRTFEDQTVFLGDQVTVFSGRNGTMKTSLMGLIAHPFDGAGKDAFGKTLKTSLSEVFNLSTQYDKDKYEYDLVLKTGDFILGEPVSIYYVAEKTNRHRVVVSGAEKGDGNFTYNTSFLNLKRLYPLVDTKATPDAGQILSQSEQAELKTFYETVLPSTEYGEFSAIHQKNIKTTFAPHGNSATYDWNSISSGEDNLGAIFNRLLGFQRSFQQGQAIGNGILCIDEFVSSLHPVAQLRLFDYLYRWSAKYKVQVVISTHSLHLIQHLYLQHQANLDADRIVINFISKAKSVNGNHPVLKNPPYKLAYKELTLEEPAAVAKARKVKVFCEDDYAIHFAKRMIKSSAVLSLAEFHSSLNPSSGVPGTPYSSLKSICINYPLLLEHSLVIFDADVGANAIAKIKDKHSFLVLPDVDSVAIERRLVYFIMRLDNADPFFQHFDKERESFLNDFTKAGIPLTPALVLNEQAVSISACKNWADSNSSAFKKYITYYASTVTAQGAFAEEFLSKLNKINLARGLPAVEI